MDGASQQQWFTTLSSSVRRRASAPFRKYVPSKFTDSSPLSITGRQHLPSRSISPNPHLVQRGSHPPSRGLDLACAVILRALVPTIGVRWCEYGLESVDVAFVSKNPIDLLFYYFDYWLYVRGIVSYTKQYAAEASAVHAQGKRYFLGETNSGASSTLPLPPKHRYLTIEQQRAAAAESAPHSVQHSGSWTTHSKAHSTASNVCTSIKARSVTAYVS